MGQWIWVEFSAKFDTSWWRKCIILEVGQIQNFGYVELCTLSLVMLISGKFEIDIYWCQSKLGTLLSMIDHLSYGSNGTVLSQLEVYGTFFYVSANERCYDVILTARQQVWIILSSLKWNILVLEILLPHQYFVAKSNFQGLFYWNSDISHWLRLCSVESETNINRSSNQIKSEGCSNMKLLSCQCNDSHDKLMKIR